MSIRMLTIFAALMLALGLQPAVPTQAAQRCFSETNQCIDGRIREFWEQNGGLVIFGLPIGGEEQSTVDGKTFTVQRFERNRLELHPENARPYDVLLGRLGADRLAQQGRDWFTFPKNGNTGRCKVFAETGHAVCGAVLNAWRKSGLKLDTRNAVSEAESLALFGLPLSDLQTETMADGKQYQVQWFERARFELHPENSAPYDVLLGLLGNEVGVLSSTQSSTIVDLQYELQELFDKDIWTYMVSRQYRIIPDASWSLKPLNYQLLTTCSECTSQPKRGYSYLIVNMQANRKGTADRIITYDFNVIVNNVKVVVEDFIIMSHKNCRLYATLSSGESTTGCLVFEVPNTGKIEVAYVPNKEDLFIPDRYLSWVIRP